MADVRDEHGTDDGPVIDEGQRLCPHCIEPIGQFDHLCPHCGRPVTAFAAIDPLKSVFAQGRAYQNATSGQPRLIVLVAMWLLFGPQLVYFAYAIVMMVRSLDTPDWGPSLGSDTLASPGLLDGISMSIGFVGILLLGALYGVILWKVTSRYCTSRHADNSAVSD